MVDSESICSDNVLVRSTHPGPQPRPQGIFTQLPVYLITRGKTVVAKGLVFTSPHIYTLPLTLTQSLIPYSLTQPIEKSTACTYREVSVSEPTDVICLHK